MCQYGVSVTVGVYMLPFQINAHGKTKATATVIQKL